MSLGHSYLISDDITFVFEFGQPQLMIFEKSNNYGATWEAYQYYAAREMGCTELDGGKVGCDGTVVSGCEYVFGMALTHDTDLTTPTQVICTDQYSGRRALSDTEVVFFINSRYSLLTNSFLPMDLAEAYDANVEFQAFLDVTDLRLQLLYPATDGLEYSAQKSLYGLGKYYYSISNIDTVVT